MSLPNAETHNVDFGIIAGSSCDEVFFIEISKIPLLANHANSIRNILPSNMPYKEKLTRTRKIFQKLVDNKPDNSRKLAINDVAYFSQFKRNIMNLNLK